MSNFTYVAAVLFELLLSLHIAVCTFRGGYHEYRGGYLEYRGGIS